MRKELVVEAYIVRNSKVLLVHHKKLGSWLPPGGHIEEGELPEETLAREIKEETGLNVKIIGKTFEKGNDDVVTTLATPHHLQVENIGEEHQHMDLVYFCKAMDGKIKLEEDKHHDIKWFSKQELKNNSNTLDNVKYFGALAIDKLNK